MILKSNQIPINDGRVRESRQQKKFEKRETGREREKRRKQEWQDSSKGRTLSFDSFFSTQIYECECKQIMIVASRQKLFLSFISLSDNFTAPATNEGE